MVGSKACRVRAASLAMGRLKSLCAQDGISAGADCACNHEAAIMYAQITTVLNEYQKLH